MERPCFCCAPTSSVHVEQTTLEASYGRRSRAFISSCHRLGTLVSISKNSSFNLAAGEDTHTRARVRAHPSMPGSSETTPTSACAAKETGPLPEQRENYPGGLAETDLSHRLVPLCTCR